MAKATRRRRAKMGKPRPDFPLFVHQTRRWCKKVKGRFAYFGPVTDDGDHGAQAALERWLEQRDDLLEQIAAEFRSPPEDFVDHGARLDWAGRRLVEALKLEAFDDPEHKTFVNRVWDVLDSDGERAAWREARRQLQKKAGVKDDPDVTPSSIDLVEQFARDCSLMADALEKDIQRARAAMETPAKGSSLEAPEPLTEAHQQAYDLICRGGPLTGKQIVTRLCLTSESLFTGKYVPRLKEHGVRNRRGLGYYHPNFYKPGPKPTGKKPVGKR